MKAILIGSASILAFSTAAAAQETAGSAPSAQTSQSAVKQDPSDGIADIVVTASRRAENVQRTALSIQAISKDALVRANVTKPEDLNSVAPGVQIARAGNYPQIYIRGVGNFSANAFAEGAVAFNLDGVYISQGWATRGMFHDLERVEVLKGPQGTLYGRNATGGAVNVITVKPQLDKVGGFGEFQVGNYSLLQGAAAVNVPIGDTAAIRASGQIVDRKGYLTDGYDDDKTQSARLQFLWQPSTDFSILLSGNYQHAFGKGSGPVLSPQLPGDKFRGASDPAVTAIFRAEPGIGPLLVPPAGDGFTDLSVYAIGAELNWNLGFANLTVIPAYRYSTQRYKTYVPSFAASSDYRDKQTSVEARLGSSTDQLKWIIGGYFFDERLDNPSGTLADRIEQGVSGLTTVSLDTRTRSYAAFGQATYSVTDRLRLTGGLRYTYERKSSDSMLNAYSFPNAVPPPLCPPGNTFTPTTPFPPLFCVQPVPVVNTLTYKNVTYKVGVEFDVAPRSMAYANLSTGFKSGGFYLAPPPDTFRPEKLTAIDAGIKNRFFDNRLQVNIEAFYWRYRDHQETGIGPTSIPGFSSLITNNAGQGTSYGADLDILFRPTPHDEFNIKLQYNKTRYSEYTYLPFGPPVTGCAVTGPLVNCSGKPFIRSPLWIGSTGYSHTIEFAQHGELRASADVQFASSSFLSTDFLQAGQQKAYAIGNFDLTYTSDGGRWVVSAFIRNIWNEVVYNQAFRTPFISSTNPLLANPDGLFVGTVRPPRTFGGRVRVNF